MLALLKSFGTSPVVADLAYPTVDDRFALIKVDLAGICRTDLHVAEDLLPHKEPVVLGHEFSGTIAQINAHPTLREGDRVTIKPVFQNLRMAGVDCDGCFAEAFRAPVDSIYRTEGIPDKRLAAYIEPIAASLAPLKSGLLRKDQKGAVFGNDRIARLTLAILKKEGFYDLDLIDDFTSQAENSYDFIIETIATDMVIKKMVSLLKPKGSLVLKSRSPLDVKVNIYELVKKEIRIDSVYYHDFDYAIAYARENSELFLPIMGQIFPMNSWEQAFRDSHNASRKLFLDPNL